MYVNFKKSRLYMFAAFNTKQLPSICLLHLVRNNQNQYISNLQNFMKKIKYKMKRFT